VPEGTAWKKPEFNAGTRRRRDAKKQEEKEREKDRALFSFLRPCASASLR
jgi:hypothetical protein